MKPLTHEEFIIRAHQAHGDLYNYGKAIYINSNTKVTIICPIHGEFQQLPRDHYKGRGCFKCSNVLNAKKQAYDTEKFIEKSNIVHNNTYTYEKTIYTKSTEKVIITCLVHGDFLQEACSHMLGVGCPTCAKQKQSTSSIGKVNGWSYTAWETKGKTSKKFTGYSLYLLMCTNAHETFLKIGKTFRGVDMRYSRKAEMPYMYVTVLQVYGSALDISKLELTLQNTYKDFHYKPLISFHGSAKECYKPEILQDLLDTIKTLNTS